MRKNMGTNDANIFLKMSVTSYLLGLVLLLCSKHSFADIGPDTVQTTTLPYSDSSAGSECPDDAKGECCLQYTWPGYKELDKVMSDNETCEDIVGDTPTPCMSTILYSNNTNPPNVSALPAFCKENRCPIWCQKAKDQTCIKWSLYRKAYNTRVLVNESRFCGKMTTDEGEVVMDGCFSYEFDGNELVACSCDTPKCNAGATIIIDHLGLLLMMLVILVPSDIFMTSPTVRIT